LYFIVFERRKEKKKMNRVNRILIISVLLVVLLSVSVYAAVPFGATVTPTVPSQSGTADGSGNDPNAIAGNITDMDVTGYTVTQAWQGYYGNVTGVITLEDTSGDVMYNWTESSPEGEIFASTNSTLNWNYIQCFNLSSVGDYSDDTGNAGGVSQYGTNTTILEAEFNITYNDADGVNETFNNGTQPQGENLVHDQFIVNSLLFTPGECNATTHLFSNSQSSEDGKFQEILMYEPSTTSVVFAAILDNNEPGFDGDPHDFQMIVLESGHGTDTNVRTYYFWVELE
jgi:hypothetical protein